jgi:hypothetical protein
MDKLLRKKDMAENLEHTATAQELAEVIEEFEQYRERLVNETMETAKRAKLPKTKVLSQLEPELAKIDAILQNLRDRQAAL